MVMVEAPRHCNGKCPCETNLSPQTGTEPDAPLRNSGFSGASWHGSSGLDGTVCCANTRGARRAVLARQYVPRVPWRPILRELGITVSFGAYGDAFDGMLECEN